MSIIQLPSYPMVNAGNYYVNGLGLVYIGTTSFYIQAGAARDSANINDISLPGIVSTSTGFNTINGCTVSTAATGLNGLDTGTIAASTLYAVYVIGSSTWGSVTPNSSAGSSASGNASNFVYYPAGGIISTSFTNPVLPYGYDMYRRIGCVLTDSSSHILNFLQENNGTTETVYNSGNIMIGGGNTSKRPMYYAALISVLTNGQATTWTAIDVTASVPKVCTSSIIFSAALTADAGATRTATFSSASGVAPVIFSSPASTIISTVVSVPNGALTSTTGIGYLVSNGSASLAASVLGYVDNL